MAEDKKDNKLQDKVIKKDDEKKSAKVEDTEAAKVDKDDKSAEEVKSADNVKSEDEADDKAESKDDEKSEDEADNKAESNDDVKSEDEVDNKAESNDDVKSEDEADNKAESKDDVKSEDETDNKAGSNDDVKSEDEADDKAESKDDVKPKGEVVDKSVSNDDKSAKPVAESSVSPQFDKTKFKNRMLATTVLSVFVSLGVGFALGHCIHPGGVAVNTAYGNITSSQIYNRVKQNQDTQMTAQSLIMEKALEHDFPKAATDQKVNARFKKIKANKFTYYQELQQLGNDTAIKDNIKDSLLLEAAVAKNSKVTEAQVKEAYKTYRPGMTMAFVQVDSASKARDVHDQLAQAKNYKDFADEVTTLHNQDSKHVSAGHLLPQISSLSDSQDVPAKIKNAAMKLNKGDVSPVIKINNKTYVILYMKSITEKSSYANDKGEIKQTLKRQEQTNSANRQRVMLKYAKKAHPKAVDSSYKDLVKQMNQVAKAND